MDSPIAWIDNVWTRAAQRFEVCLEGPIGCVDTGNVFLDALLGIGLFLAFWSVVIIAGLVTLAYLIRQFVRFRAALFARIKVALEGRKIRRSLVLIAAHALLTVLPLLLASPLVLAFFGIRALGEKSKPTNEGVAGGPISGSHTAEAMLLGGAMLTNPGKVIAARKLRNTILR